MHLPRFTPPILLPLACAALAAAGVARADPIGIQYDAFFDGPVLDANGVLAIEAHSSVVQPTPFLTFDGSPEALPGNAAFYPGSPPPVQALLPAPTLIISESVMPMGGLILVEFWLFGGSVDSPTALFANTVAAESSGVSVGFGVVPLYWIGVLSSEGHSAQIVEASFTVTYDGLPDLEILPLVDNGFGSGTEDDPFFLLWNFDPDPFQDATDFHVALKIQHLVPEPGAVGLLAAALSVLALGRRPRRPAR